MSLQAKGNLIALAVWIAALLILCEVLMGQCVTPARADVSSQDDPANVIALTPPSGACPLSPGWNLVTLEGNATLTGCGVVWILK